MDRRRCRGTCRVDEFHLKAHVGAQTRLIEYKHTSRELYCRNNYLIKDNYIISFMTINFRKLLRV